MKLIRKVLLAIVFLFSVVNIYAQDTYFVTAPNGLILRDSPDKNANKITVIPYKSEIEVLENTKAKLELTDNGELIKGEWVKIKLNNDSDTHTGYVFNGYLIHETKLIVPYKKMGIVTANTSKQDLYEICRGNIKDTIVFSYEDIDVTGTQIIYPGKPANRIKIIWDANNMPEKVWINEGDLKTMSGIGIGSTISEVEKANKNTFWLNGFEIDHYIAGSVTDWENGKLKGFGIQFEPTRNIGEDYQKIIGGEFSSNDPYIQKAGLTVMMMMIEFSNSQ